jgi:hypothetical protein
VDPSTGVISGKPATAGTTRVTISVSSSAPNFVEYALGTDPLTPGALSFGLPLENGFLTQTATRNPNAIGISWSAESSSDQVHWSGTDVTVLEDTPTPSKPATTCIIPDRPRIGDANLF